MMHEIGMWYFYIQLTYRKGNDVGGAEDVKGLFANRVEHYWAQKGEPAISY